MTDANIREIEEPTGTKGEKPAKEEDWKSFGWFLVKLVIVVLVFRTFFFTSFNIPSESMLPRLLVGDYLQAQKWSYGYSRFSLPFDLDVGDGRIFASQPDRGDIVIFKHPVDEADYIKRVIGLPGDTVQMASGVLLLNGVPVGTERIEDLVLPVESPMVCRAGGEFVPANGGDAATCIYPQFRETLPGGVSYNILDLGTFPQDDTAPITVPEGMLFLMGDNRDNSLDSRFPAEPGRGIGLVPEANLVAEASFMYWSTDGTSEWVKPWTWFTAARWSRMFRGI
ncbi:signal peptidase I [Aurantiacibacter aquimixticola]|uniref:Signal peptidase I n=1 Tax=Aurantiacibacter aquimixticola TaxID=1958945 RepID=A0A419RSB5_9SPHN|nr:signal peptidase I [Aurantiacibacter aquimixticola]RJY08666.1 signal peptidase I [Aurantiacibacter aquimixticola]